MHLGRLVAGMPPSLLQVSVLVFFLLYVVGDVRYFNLVSSAKARFRLYRRSSTDGEAAGSILTTNLTIKPHGLCRN